MGKNIHLFCPSCNYLLWSTDLQPGASDARWVRLPERLCSAAVCAGHPSPSDLRRWAVFFKKTIFLCPFCEILAPSVTCKQAVMLWIFTSCLLLSPSKDPMKWWGWSFPEICCRSRDESHPLELNWPHCYGLHIWFVTVRLVWRCPVFPQVV